jgi:hypothetical protein
MSYWYHPEEDGQVGELMQYEDDHPGTRYLVSFRDGEAYTCVYDVSYQSDNAGELDIEMDHPAYDEFYQVSMRIIETVQKGLRPYNEWLNLDFRDFPVLIKDLDTGTVVYREGGVQRP